MLHHFLLLMSAFLFRFLNIILSILFLQLTKNSVTTKRYPIQGQRPTEMSCSGGILELGSTDTRPFTGPARHLAPGSTHSRHSMPGRNPEGRVNVHQTCCMSCRTTPASRVNTHWTCPVLAECWIGLFIQSFSKLLSLDIFLENFDINKLVSCYAFLKG